MCTVVFIPAAHGMLFSSNRDESAQRAAATPPTWYEVANGQILYPRDGLASGTWAGTHRNGRVMILLNGGFTAHVRAAAYRKSRGLILTELLGRRDAAAGWEQIDLEQIEPFTLVVWVNKSLQEWVWDGTKKYTLKHDHTRPHIWSSSTLYTPEAKQNRKDRFNRWLMDCPIPGKQQLLEFLCSYTDAQNGFLMNRNNRVQTLSISTIELVNASTATFHYNDLLAEEETLMSWYPDADGNN